MKEIVVPFVSFDEQERMGFVDFGEPAPPSEKPERYYPGFQAMVNEMMVRILEDVHGAAFLQLISSPEGIVERVKIGEQFYRLVPTQEDAEILKLEGIGYRRLRRQIIQAPAESRLADHMTLFVRTALEGGRDPELFGD